ncbi:MAG TPA: FAD-dependent monooxygenase, partial [Nitrospiraceae bacterium]|nr:FAD-dependent monooxygenase [Nitrospiraceae bacterium]
VVLEQAGGPPTGLRGEILQPNGQAILDRLGILSKLPSDAVRPVRYFHFCRAGETKATALQGGRPQRMCTIDYGMLPPPYNRAIVTLPNAAHHAVLNALENVAPGALRYGAEFKGLIRDGDRIAGVEAEHAGQRVTISAKIVVGADGALSKVRDALGIRACLHRYPEAYLIAILEGPDEMAEARYFVGRRTILGVFPATGRKVYLFYMIPADSMSQIKRTGLRPLREQWSKIAPDLAATFRTLVDWKQTAYMPTGRVYTDTWVADGAVLIGDAAHAMNPHASQGRMQAMMDAMVLADLIPGCLDKHDCSAAALASFERTRRPHVEMLQRLADEQVRFWNTGNPLLGFLRDRVFKTLDRNRRLRYQVLSTTAGLRTSPPFGMLDRLIAAGLLPDLHADRLPADAMVQTG